MSERPIPARDRDNRQLFSADPDQWVSSKNRLLRSALLNQDYEIVDMITKDVASVFGEVTAQLWKLWVWGELAAEDAKRSE